MPRKKCFFEIKWNMLFLSKAFYSIQWFCRRTMEVPYLKISRFFFQPKIVDSFLISPRKHVVVLIRSASRGASNEYPQNMFSWRNKKTIYLIPPLSWSYEVQIRMYACAYWFEHSLFAHAVKTPFIHGTDSWAARWNPVPYEADQAKTRINLPSTQSNKSLSGLSLGSIFKCRECSAQTFDQSARVRRLIWGFVGAHIIQYLFSRCGSSQDVCQSKRWLLVHTRSEAMAIWGVSEHPVQAITNCKLNLFSIIDSAISENIDQTPRMCILTLNAAVFVQPKGMFLLTLP